MRRTALVTAAVLAMGTAAVCIVVAIRSRAGPKAPPAPRRVSAHGAEIDNDHATALAMYRAPEGATPCESAHNALVAEREAARSLGRQSIFAFVAERDVFLAGCAALTPEARACLVPRYEARHRDACKKARPPEVQLAPLLRFRPGIQSEEAPPEVPLLAPAP